MPSVLISIQPYWCHKIIQLLKTVELRKTAPALKPPFKCYIYMTATKRRGQLWEWDTAYETPSRELRDGSQKIIGEFVCDSVEPVTPQNRHAISEASCVPLPDMYNYAGPKGLTKLKAWHISKLVIYDEARALNSFESPCICTGEYEGETYCDCLNCERAEDSDRGVIACDRTLKRPPQSWFYVEAKKAS